MLGSYYHSACGALALLSAWLGCWEGLTVMGLLLYYKLLFILQAKIIILG